MLKDQYPESIRPEAELRAIYFDGEHYPYTPGAQAKLDEYGAVPTQYNIDTTKPALIPAEIVIKAGKAQGRRIPTTIAYNPCGNQD